MFKGLFFEILKISREPNFSDFAKRFSRILPEKKHFQYYLNAKNFEFSVEHEKKNLKEFCFNLDAFNPLHHQLKTKITHQIQMLDILINDFKKWEIDSTSSQIEDYPGDPIELPLNKDELFRKTVAIFMAESVPDLTLNILLERIFNCEDNDDAVIIELIINELEFYETFGSLRDPFGALISKLGSFTPSIVSSEQVKSELKNLIRRFTDYEIQTQIKESEQSHFTEVLRSMPPKHQVQKALFIAELANIIAPLETFKTLSELEFVQPLDSINDFFIKLKEKKDTLEEKVSHLKSSGLESKKLLLEMENQLQRLEMFIERLEEINVINTHANILSPLLTSETNSLNLESNSFIIPLLTDESISQDLEHHELNIEDLPLMVESSSIPSNENEFEDFIITESSDYFIEKDAEHSEELTPKIDHKSGSPIFFIKNYAAVIQDSLDSIDKKTYFNS